MYLIMPIPVAKPYMSDRTKQNVPREPLHDIDLFLVHFILFQFLKIPLEKEAVFYRPRNMGISQW